METKVFSSLETSSKAASLTACGEVRSSAPATSSAGTLTSLTSAPKVMAGAPMAMPMIAFTRGSGPKPHWVLPPAAASAVTLPFDPHPGACARFTVLAGVNPDQRNSLTLGGAVTRWDPSPRARPVKAWAASPSHPVLIHVSDTLTDATASATKRPRRGWTNMRLRGRRPGRSGLSPLEASPRGRAVLGRRCAPGRRKTGILDCIAV